MTGKAMGEEAGKVLASNIKAKFATNIKRNVTSTTIDLTLQNGVKDSSGNLGTLGNTATLPAAVAGSAAGVMTASDKTKLDGIAAGANNYTHPTTSGNKHIPSGGSSGQILRWSSDGTAAWGADNNTTYSAGSGIGLSGTTFSNAGVRSVATGTANGTVSVNTNGTTANVSVKGLGSAAYTASSAYAAASHTHSYAGSSSAGGAATSANKLNTNAGSEGNPVYFANGVPVKSKYTVTSSMATGEYGDVLVPTCNAVYTAINAAKTNAAMYKGAANAYTDITNTSYEAGNYWVVKTVGTYAGQACEVGDMIFANTTKGTAAADADFDVIQANIDFLTASDVEGWFA